MNPPNRIFSPIFETPTIIKATWWIRLVKWANRITKTHTNKVMKKRKIEQFKAKDCIYL